MNMKNKIVFRVVSKPIGKGMLSILINANQCGRSVNLETGVNVFRGEWDDAFGMVVDNPNAHSLNKFIRQTLYDLETMEFDSGMTISITTMKKMYEARVVTDDFYHFCDVMIPTRDISAGTKTIHKDWLKKIKRFRSECKICELSEEWVRDYHRWLVERKDADSTIQKAMSILKVYWNIAKKRYGNKVADDIFDWYHPKTSRAFKAKALSDDDIRLIENFICSPSTKSLHRNIMEKFLFMSYTGCRYSDFKSLKRENFKYDNGKLWLTYVSVKTKTPVHIPLFALFDGRAEQIYHKHLGDFDVFFSMQCNGHYNQMVKKICEGIGITKRVTTHIARHTCATRLINKDVPITTIQRIIGHRQIRMTMEYAKTSDEALVRQLIGRQ